MINAAPLARFRAFRDRPLLRPIYADYAFANLPATVVFQLTGENRPPLLPAERLGARVLLAPREGPAGWRSVVSTPHGGEVAFWQPKR